MTDRCPHCDKKREVVDGLFDYTVLSGLDPTNYRVELYGIIVRRCGCGLSPLLPLSPLMKMMSVLSSTPSLSTSSITRPMWSKGAVHTECGCDPPCGETRPSRSTTKPSYPSEPTRCRVQNMATAPIV